MYKINHFPEMQWLEVMQGKKKKILNPRLRTSRESIKNGQMERFMDNLGL